MEDDTLSERMCKILVWSLMHSLDSHSKDPLREPFGRILSILNSSGVPTLSVDIPSGGTSILET